MPSFKIDTSTAVVFVATAPEPKVKNYATGERAMNLEGKPLSTVGLLVSDDGEGNLLKVVIPENGFPEGLVPGMPVKVVGLKARDWDNVIKGERKQGISFSAVAITPAA
ncbi:MULTISPECIES: SCO3933 family regulatory protein [unclassified Streptomyces]|uniref:Regulatory protein n=1 Tax=Streptomyces sp. 900105245 TaxID=3154379 RepID=A0ABV1U934_9ACTN